MRSPRFTRDSDGYPRRRLLLGSKGVVLETIFLTHGVLRWVRVGEYRTGLLKPLRTVDPAEVPVERAERRMAGLARDLEHKTI